MSPKTETVTLGGGCFWCLDAVYRQVEGVHASIAGYAGGSKPDPTYEEVCSGRTGHAEVVQVTYDPDVITFDDILDIFFTIHDPTTPNRQGGDVGTQYRSVIFHHDEAQQEDAEAKIEELNEAELWDDPIVTEISPLETFYPAEDYHQDYFAKNPYQPYCRAVVGPKVAKFRKKWANRLRATA